MAQTIALVLALVFISLAAPTQASGISPEMERDIRALIDLKGAEDLARALLSGETATPEVAASMVKAMLVPGGLVDRLIPIYGKYYDHEEIRKLVAHYSPHESYDFSNFYRSPLGQKVLAVTPLLRDDLLEAATEWIAPQEDALQRNRCPLGESDLTYYASKELDVQPRPTSKITPQYPKQADEKGISGSVGLEVKVDEQGQVQEIRVINSAPSGVFDQSVIDAFRNAAFLPACKNGFAVRSVLRVEVRFEFPSQTQ